MTVKTQHETSNFPPSQTMEQDENCQNPSLKHHPTIVGGWSNPFENLLVKIDHFPKWGENFNKNWNHHPMLFQNTKVLRKLLLHL